LHALLRAAAVLLAGGLALLGGCRTVPPGAVRGPGAEAPWPEQRAALDQLDRYGLQGRVAVAANGQGFSASLRYSQKRPHTANLSLDGPLGIGGLRVDVDGEEVAIATSRGEQLDGREARAELERRLGFQLPLQELRWWLLGIPAPGEAAINAADNGEIRDFTQNGWRVSINSRAAGLGFSLPQRLTAEREGARLKLLVERWE
jgi:outer membrane lipoprotein LolB